MKPLPEGLPPLPEGYVYLGKGGEFIVDGNFSGMAYLPDLRYGWRSGDSWMGTWRSHHYAAPADSEIARLNQGRPSWDDAPDWAEWLAQDEDGQWWWYETYPFKQKRFWMPRGGKVELGQHNEPNPDWRETIERRPKATKFGFTEEEAHRVEKALAEFSFDERDEPDLVIPADIDAQCTYAEIEPIIEAAKEMGYSIEWSEDGGVRGWKK